MRKICVALLVLCMAPDAVFAQDDAQMLGIETRARVQIGGQRPAIIVRPRAGVKRLGVLLKAADTGKTIRLKAGKIRLGSSKELTWSQAVGTQKWTASFDVQYQGGKKHQFSITLETTVFPKIASKLTKADVNLEERFLEMTLNQPAGKVDVQVIGDYGKVIFKDTQVFAGEKPGTPLRVDWEQPKGVGVLKIDLRAWSEFGFWVGTEVTPFEVQIPHEEVVFEFGKWSITASEAPKLDKTMTLLSDKVRRFGGLVKLQLYVAGYTDTVGSRGSNRELSEKRARSIATYFRHKGLKIPVFYQGFGEDALAIQTPDETKESRNRRAVYVLSASAPAMQKSIPRASWKRL